MDELVVRHIHNFIWLKLQRLKLCEQIVREQETTNPTWQ